MKLLTLDQLYQFCLTNKFYNFNSKDSGYQLCVQVPAKFEKEASDDTLLFVKIKVFHTGKNRNKSNVTVDAAKKAMKKMAYKPILANFTDVNGEADFTSHDGYIDEDGNWKYLERQIGCFTTDKPYMEQDPDNEDRQYVYAYGVIPREYTEAADIIERKNGTKVSVELAVNEMSFDAENKELILEDVNVMGCTCLGVDEDGNPVGEGMEGSRLDIEDFSADNSACFNIKNDQTDLVKTLERLNATLSKFNIDSKSEKEVKNEMSFMETLMEKYGVTLEDIDFDFETMNDEELEKAFADKFETSEETPVEENAEEPEENNEEFADDDDEDGDEDGGDDPADEPDTDEDDYTGDDEVSPKKYSIEMSDGTVKEFALSLQDKISALDTLVNETYSETDNDYYYTLVYDKDVVMVSYWTGTAYRQAYKERKGVYSLQGDRVSVHALYVTDDEEAELDRIRSNYSVIETELSEYKYAEEKANKNALMKSEEYSSIANTKEFGEIKVDELSFEELKGELDSILLNYAKAGKLSFAEKKTEKKLSVKPLPFNAKKKKGRYGSLFSNDK